MTICIVVLLDESGGGVKYSTPKSVDNSILRPAAALFSVMVHGQGTQSIVIGNGVELDNDPVNCTFMNASL